MTEDELEQQCAKVGEKIGVHLPPGFGFALILFDFGERGNLAYMSNGEREDMLRVLQELIDHMNN